MQYKRGEEAFNSINQELSQLHKAKTQGFIYRVHEHLRDVNSKSYEPKMLAIGPYHHDKDSCKMMEEHKLRYLQSILSRREEATAERYISAVAELEEEARSCYTEPINLSQENFIKMLVLDGCFIIELVRKAKANNMASISNDPVFYTGWITNVLQRDVIMFENQIPFFVLCRLFDLIEAPDQRDMLIELLVFFCQDLFPDWEYRKQKNSSPHDVKHLLELIYKLWIPESFDGVVIPSRFFPGPDGVVIPNRYSPGPFTVRDTSPGTVRDWRFIHSATELKDANLKFKKRESCDSLFEVTFQNGTMLMPPLSINDMTECFFRNLIAYEQYFPNAQHNYVTDYVVLLDLLINSSKDVDVLSECGIIESWLGDNEVTANMFNKLAESVVGSTIYGYGKTFKDINSFYNKRWNRWMAVLNRDYFSSPWTSISLFAAFALLLLTIVQTVCSIIQVEAM